MTDTSPRVVRYHLRRILREYSDSLAHADPKTRRLIYETVEVLHPDAAKILSGSWHRFGSDYWRRQEGPSYEFAFEQLPHSKPMHEQGRWGGHRRHAQEVADLYQVRVFLTHNGVTIGNPIEPHKRRLETWDGSL